MKNFIFAMMLGVLLPLISVAQTNQLTSQEMEEIIATTEPISRDTVSSEEKLSCSIDIILSQYCGFTNILAVCGDNDCATFSLTNSVGTVIGGQNTNVVISGNYTMTTTGISGCTSVINFTVLVVLPTIYYRDLDNDGFGNSAVTQTGCSQPSGYVANNADCDDNDPLEKPGQVWYKDTDNDGYAQTGAPTITQCSRPVGYKAAIELTATTGDCNDNNATINPAATEVCDGSDNDCDGAIDEGVSLPVSITVFDNSGIALNDGVICSGANVTLTANGGTNYLWSTGQTGATISVSPVTTTMYTVTGNNNGCSGTATRTIIVNPLPATPTITPSVVGQTVTLSSSAVGVSFWYLNNEQSSVGVGQTFSPNVSGLYSVTTSNQFACFSTSQVVPVAITTCIPDTVTIVNTVIVYQDTCILGCELPVASFGYSEPGGLTVFFFDQSSGVPTQWLWNFGDGSPTTTAQNPGNHTFPGPGNYTVTLTVTNNCGSNTTSQNVTVEEPPCTPAVVLVESPDVTIGYGDATTLTVLLAGGNIGHSIIWTPQINYPNYPDGGVEDWTSFNYKIRGAYMNPGVYNFQYVVDLESGCPVVGTVQVTVLSNTTGTDDTSTEKVKIIASPNPTDGVVVLEGVENGTSVWIYDSTGQLLEVQDYLNNIDLVDLPSGVYFLKPFGYDTIKVVKQ